MVDFSHLRRTQGAHRHRAALHQGAHHARSPPSATASRASRWTCSRRPGSSASSTRPCPTEYGGAGLGELENALIAEELAYGCTGIQTSILANALALTPIKLAGNEEQKKKYLGMLTSRADLRELRDDRARRRERRRGPEDALREARRRLRAQRPEVLDHERELRALLRRSSRRATPRYATRASPRSSSIATRPGSASARRRTSSASARATRPQVLLEDVKVPKENLLAPEGKGFKLAMETFNQTRPDIGAAATGLMRRCLDECVAYAKERKTFGVPIANHQLVQCDDRRDGHPHRGDAPALSEGGVEPRQRRPRSHRLELRQGVRRRQRDADRDRRRAGLRRQRLREGVPGREADARREGAPDLRGHEPDPAASSSPSSSSAAEPGAREQLGRLARGAGGE